MPKQSSRQAITLHINDLLHNHTSVGIDRLSDSGVDGNGVDSQKPIDNSDQARSAAADKSPDDGGVPVPSGFKLTSGNGWSVETVGSSDRADSGSTTWSVAIATQDQDKSERLGVFISFDIGQLLNKREWQMTLEQEMAKVRQRVRQLLSARRKNGSGGFHSM